MTLIINGRKFPIQLFHRLHQIQKDQINEYGHQVFTIKEIKQHGEQVIKQRRNKSQNITNDNVDEDFKNKYQ